MFGLPTGCRPDYLAVHLPLDQQQPHLVSEGKQRRNTLNRTTDMACRVSLRNPVLQPPLRMVPASERPARFPYPRMPGWPEVTARGCVHRSQSRTPPRPVRGTYRTACAKALVYLHHSETNISAFQTGINPQHYNHSFALTHSASIYPIYWLLTCGTALADSARQTSRPVWQRRPSRFHEYPTHYRTSAATWPIAAPADSALGRYTRTRNGAGGGGRLPHAVRRTASFALLVG